MKNFHSLSIKEITRETPKAVSIAFDIPPNLADIFTYTAGQYITIKTEINGKEVRRSYSICSSPKSGELKIGVKEVKNGLFSPIANNKLKVGDILHIFPPEGKFTFEPDTTSPAHKNYAAFVAGSGITPVLSIVKTALEQEEHSKFVLVYGNKTPQETMYFKELLEVQAKFPHRLFLEFVYSQAQDKDAFFGRIEKSTVNYVLRNKFKGHHFNEIFLCGPETMINSVSETLRENNIPEKCIHFELFSSSEEGEIDAPLEGNTNVTIILDDDETTFEMSKKSTILDAALEKDLDAPYSCQGGICSSCVARVVEGHAEMAKNQILTDAEISEGLILTCQAHPTTPNIKVDYDDV
ncbi:MAG TPA: ferredoxin--NADP reductase [Flavobacteriaceae bacterium]|nr:ferredoxin--NADP reductase [Flavobacteriaceae bacterium]